jgi:cytochrome c oxidase subunit 2
MRQELAWWASVVVALTLGIVFLTVARSAPASPPTEYGPVQTSSARARRWLFWSLVLVTVLVSAISLRSLPYGAESGSSTAQTIGVTGHQWTWEMTAKSVPVGTTVDFGVTSADVNHGFAVYDDQMRMVAQVQAMPGYVNHLRVMFAHEGKYTIMCLEYCGSVHHYMTTDFTVTGQRVGLVPAAPGGAR